MIDKIPGVYLFRHGEAANNVMSNYIAGRSNYLPLTENGIEQSRRLGHVLMRIGFNPELVYSSPALRAQQTAYYTLSELPEAQRVGIIDDRLQEQDTGKWTGCVATDIFTKSTIEAIEHQGNSFRSPGGESFNDVGARMLNWLEEQDYNRQIAAFTHGGAIRCLAAYIKNWSHDRTYKMQPGNTSVSLFTKENNKWQLQYIGKSAEDLEI